jgi:hypothetical protein
MIYVTFHGDDLMCEDKVIPTKESPTKESPTKEGSADTILYTVEADASAKQARKEMAVEDPAPERAIAVLAGEENPDEPTNR